MTSKERMMHTAEVDKLAAEARRDLAKAKKQDKVLDEQMAKQVDKIFDDYDTDDSGFITMSNFRDAIDDMLTWDDKLYPAVFRKMDTSGDGTLTKGELAVGLNLINAAKVFDGMDTDNSGVLDRNQWMTVAMRCKFSPQDAENIFVEFDDDNNNVMDYMEFLDCFNDLQGVFMMNDIQTRIDQTRDEIKKIEKMVSGLLSEIAGKRGTLDKAQARRDKHAEAKQTVKSQVDEQLAFFGDKGKLISGHKDKLDVMSMSVGELKQKFKQYKGEMHQAFENKQWQVCMELAEELSVIKYELDEQTGQHTLMLQAHANEQSVMETTTVNHAQADVELRHLHDLLMEAEAHHDEIAAAHGGALTELRDAEARYEMLKVRLRELEEQGARAGLSNAMKKLDKQLEIVHKANSRILDLCKRFNMYFKIKDFAQVSLIGAQLMANDAKADRAEHERDRLLLLVKDKKAEMDHIDKRNVAAKQQQGDAAERARNEFR